MVSTTIAALGTPGSPAAERAEVFICQRGRRVIRAHQIRCRVVGRRVDVCAIYEYSKYDSYTAWVLHCKIQLYKIRLDFKSKMLPYTVVLPSMYTIPYGYRQVYIRSKGGFAADTPYYGCTITMADTRVAEHQAQKTFIVIWFSEMPPSVATRHYGRVEQVLHDA